MRRAPSRYRPPPAVRTVPRMDHDATWKRLFALPCMVEHLLRGFASPAAALLDLSTLRALPASWAGPDTEQRHSDMVWRADYADGSGRSLVVVLELQSSVDRSMAVRVLRYASMAYEASMRRGEADADGEVRVLPVVVYSGRSQWTAPGAELAVGVTTDGEVSIPPPHVYLSIDARRRARGRLPPRNLVSTLFELGVVEGPSDVAGPMGALLEWLPGSGLPVEDVLSGFGQWLSVTLPRLFPGSGAGAVVEALRRELEGERGGRTMLAERVKEWEAEWLRQGMEQGMEQGRRQGIEQGVERGRRQGIEQGVARLRRQAMRKFGVPVVERFSALLDGVDGAERLDEVGDWLIECDTASVLLERMERLHAGR